VFEVRELVEALKEGRAVFGSRETVKALLTGKPKLVFIASNCSPGERETITYYSRLAGVQVKAIRENSMELGSVCGKPFRVSASTILE
jgi:large subunit ribosomal protein L30e